MFWVGCPKRHLTREGSGRENVQAGEAGRGAALSAELRLEEMMGKRTRTRWRRQGMTGVRRAGGSGQKEVMDGAMRATRKRTHWI